MSFFVVLVLIGTSVAQAQSNDFSSRLNRLENELETLNRAVYNGEEPPAPWMNSRVVSNDATAQMEVRLQNMEEQMRALTGRIEEQVFTINKLKMDIANMQAANIKPPSQPQTPPQYGANQISNSARSDIAEIEKPVELDWKDQSENETAPASVLSTGDATALYESAYASLKNKEYKKSRNKFEQFLREHPNHVLAANSKYWLGETFYVEGEYRQAAKTFAQGFQKYPKSAKSPDMLLKLGLSLSNSGKKEEACIALSQLPVRFKAGSQDILDRGVDEMDRLGCSG
ncbi:MAG: tol-pal system protein YbgF [Pseudomonadota bacterium]